MTAQGDPGFDWVRPGLAIGGCVPAETAARLAREHGLRLVVDLREEACDDAAVLAAAGLELLHLPTPDNAAVSPGHLEQGVARLMQVLKHGAGGLVHCQHGIGRSALLVLCVLTARGLAPLDALQTLKSARHRVSPSPAQYQAWAAWLRRQRADPPAFDEFAAIAYRHLSSA